ncbi:Metallo-dependent phosphatase-like protein [Tribonema minus]|uniref:Metallo-dependent phosphatase-like protein n=1 Tax=Tribonema minus TaxID=303371 RepID=A0A835ZLT4_9STRA|nr:Metallo-dependent phosphatase-like protein [Tribonema minus]
MRAAAPPPPPPPPPSRSPHNTRELHESCIPRAVRSRSHRASTSTLEHRRVCCAHTVPPLRITALTSPPPPPASPPPQCNAVFDRLPLAAVIDNDIFCVHGGIPRPIAGSSSRVQDIMMVPSVAGVCPPNDAETFESQQVASDCLWSDPARDEQELVLDESGFGESLRGGGAICFGTKAIDDFLKQGQLSYIVRAHEAHSEGVSLSKGAKVFTVFSTSKDHGQGRGAMCGCILVDFEKLLVINRSTKYKNKYVHRRDSVSLLNLSMQELKKRAELGLICSDMLSEESGSEEEANDFEGYYDHAVGEEHYSSEEEGKTNGHANAIGGASSKRK